MATIRDLLRDELVIDDIRATDKTGVLREFAGLLQSKGRVRDSGELLRTLMERESLGSTGIGDGVAIPHGKLAFIPDIIVAFGRSSRGIDFQSLDRKPAYLFFLIITPIDKPGDHLKMLARVSRILKNPMLRDNLRHAPDGKEIQRLICEEDGRYPQR
ncbi:MAG TPA: PTS sugar transporter subunit IIA [Nitrospirota bacterium]|nr:PTS sugar transporter subunit IIA [Nitrospirota bacterium]